MFARGLKVSTRGAKSIGNLKGVLAASSSALKSLYSTYAEEIPNHSVFTHSELPQETLYIMDGTSMIYNAFYSREATDTFGESTAQHNGEAIPCGALAAMGMHFARFIRDVKPRYVVAAMDVSRETFRTEIYPEYKQQRPPAPDDLAPQFGLVAPVLEAMGCHIYSAPGYEADDVMATLTEWARDRGLNVCIVSGDKDMLQLVRTGVHVMNPRMPRTMLGEREVFEKYGVPPRALCDLMALIGDDADNIPGVYGVGPKIAAALMNKYRTVDEMYQRLEEEVTAAKEAIDGFDLHTCLTSTKKDHALPPALEDAFTLVGAKSKPKTTIKKLMSSTREEVMLYKQLVKLEDAIPGVIEDLADHNSSRFRYIGERAHVEDFFCGLDRDSFLQPLTLLRQQYHKIDRIV